MLALRRPGCGGTSAPSASARRRRWRRRPGWHARSPSPTSRARCARPGPRPGARGTRTGCGHRGRRHRPRPRPPPGGRDGWRRCASQFRSGDWHTTRSGRTRRITREMAARNSRLAVTRPSGNPRKVTSVTPTARRRLQLLLAADGGHLGPGDRLVRAAGVTVGDDAVGHLDAPAGPRRHRAGGAEVDVVGVGGDDQDAARRHRIRRRWSAAQVGRARDAPRWSTGRRRSARKVDRRRLGRVPVRLRISRGSRRPGRPGGGRWRTSRRWASAGRSGSGCARSRGPGSTGRARRPGRPEPARAVRPERWR